MNQLLFHYKHVSTDNFKYSDAISGVETPQFNDVATAKRPQPDPYKGKKSQGMVSYSMY